jgi:hypothetical protein
MLLALLTISTIYYSLKRKYTGFIICASLLMLAKEQGVVIYVGLTLANILYLSINSKLTAKILGFHSLPFLPITTFFVHQYFVQGWVFYPHHLDLIEFSFEALFNRFYDMYRILFGEDGRFILKWSSFLAIIYVIGKRNWKLAILTVALFFVLTKVLFGYWEFPLFAVVPVCLILVFFIHKFWFHNSKSSENNKIQQLIIISVFITTFYLGFSGINFFTNRYLLALIPVFIISTISIINNTLSSNRYLIPLIFVLTSVANFHFQNDQKVWDTNVNYADGIRTLQTAILELEKRNIYDDQIFADYLDTYCVNNPKLGYRTTKETFTHFSIENNESTEYYFVNNFYEPFSEFNDSNKIEVFHVQHGIAGYKLFKKVNSSHSE